jgi:hypothetical protein
LSWLRHRRGPGGDHSGRVAVFIFSNFKIQFTAVNFTPEGELHPCADLDGMKANVQFFEASSLLKGRFSQSSSVNKTEIQDLLKNQRLKHTLAMNIKQGVRSSCVY